MKPNYIIEDETVRSELQRRGFEFYRYLDLPQNCPAADLHVHDAIEFIYVVEGSISATVDEFEEYLEKGDLVLFRSQGVHSIKTNEKSINKYYILKISTTLLQSILPKDMAASILFRFCVYNGNLKRVWRKNEILGTEIMKRLDAMINNCELGGKFVDISIFKVNLPKIVKGENTLIITLPFGDSANLENVFILGKFGVKIDGKNTTITNLPEKISFGDITQKGFPFYGGNITYKIPVEVTNNTLKVCASDYRGALMGAALDGKEIGKIVYPPYCVCEKDVENGSHLLELTLFTHRYNTFGPVHLVNEKESWHGPGAWRSTGVNWSYEYVLRKTGILKAPVTE